MMKMLIKLDEERIKREDEYELSEIWNVIDKHFMKACTKERLGNGAIMYQGKDGKDYYTDIMGAYMALPDKAWFMKYCVEWRFFDNDDNEELPYQEIDVLVREMRNTALFESTYRRVRT